MIVDCHSHIWESPQQLGRGESLCALRNRTTGQNKPYCANINDHLAATEPVDKTIVLAIKSHYLQADVPNDFVAKYVRQYPERLIGFACIDPSRPKEAIDDLKKAHDELGLKGVMVWPAAQDFHPVSTGAMRIYAEICRLQMPVMFHQDIQASILSKMEFARPYLIDEVAREYPDLKIIISQLGLPWIDETIALLSKHHNVFADISGLLSHPWRAYIALISVYQAGVMDALLFGSNFPCTSAAECIESIYSINQFCQGTNLPSIPREQLRQIVERDALKLIGIESHEMHAQAEPDTTVIQHED